MSAAQQYEFVVALLVAIAVLEAIANRFRLPPAAAFILGGAALAIIPGVPHLQIDPNLLLIAFLPTLLMSGGYFTAWTDFRARLGGIALLAVGAVAFTTAVVGVVAHVLVPALPWAICFALGAVVSPPDAAAASAILRQLSLPTGVTTMLEGESLLNDASGLVLFRFAIAAALTGEFSILRAGASFALLTLGGVAFGWIIGRAGLALMRRLGDGNPAILVTFLLPTTAFAGGEHLHVSGVLAVVTTGILVGRYQHGAVPAATRIRAQALWGSLVYLLESLLFVLIGLALRDVLGRALHHAGSTRSLWLPVAGVIAATVVARFAWIYAMFSWRSARRALGAQDVDRPSLARATVVGWAGMRGVVTLAAALSMPQGLPGRDFVLVSAFAVIMFTVLVQGSTLRPLIRSVGLTRTSDSADRRRSEAKARARIAEVQLHVISDGSRQADGTQRHPRLLKQYQLRAALATQTVDDREAHAAFRAEHFDAILRAVQAGRAEALRLHANGTIHDDVLRSIEWELDLQQVAAERQSEL